MTGTRLNGPLSESFVVQFPLNNIDPGPRQGQFPTNPMLANGPTVNQALLDQLYPEGAILTNTGVIQLDNPDRKNAWSRQYSLGYYPKNRSAEGKRRRLKVRVGLPDAVVRARGGYIYKAEAGATER